MDRRTYKALRRSLIFTKLAEMMDGLYGLRLKLVEEWDLERMLDDGGNVITYTAEELLAELDEEDE